MAFETYVPQRGRASGKTTIRILKSGDLSVSPGVYEQWFRRAGHVELLFDPKGKKIGLRPRSKPSRATYKLRESPQGSYTAKLAAQGVVGVAQKVGEEGVELALAAVAQGPEETVAEAADLLFHLLVLLGVKGIPLASVVAALEDRHRSRTR